MVDVDENKLALRRSMQRFLECHQAAMPPDSFSGKRKPCRCGACEEARGLLGEQAPIDHDPMTIIVTKLPTEFHAHIEGHIGWCETAETSELAICRLISRYKNETGIRFHRNPDAQTPAGVEVRQ